MQEKEAIPKDVPAVNTLQKAMKDIHMISSKIASLEAAAQKDPDDNELAELVAKKKKQKEEMQAQAELLKDPQPKFKRPKKDHETAMANLATYEQQEAAMQALLAAKQQEIQVQKEAVLKFKQVMDSAQAACSTATTETASTRSRSPSPSPADMAEQLRTSLQGPARESYEQ